MGILAYRNKIITLDNHPFFFGVSNAVPLIGKFWVGNSGNWNDTSHWSETNGGPGGASVPTSTNNAYFTADSFSTTSTVTVNIEAYCLSLNMSTVDQSVAFTLQNNFYSYGNFILGTNVTLSGNYDINVGLNNASINTYGNSIHMLYLIGNVSVLPTVTLLSDLTLGGTESYLCMQNEGYLIFDANDFNITANGHVSFQTTNITVYMGNGTWNFVGAFNYGGWMFILNAAIYSEGSTVIFDKTGIDAVHLYNIVPTNGISGILNIVQFKNTAGQIDSYQGYGTFNLSCQDMIIDAGVKLHLSNGTTTIGRSFTAIGTSGNEITLDSRDGINPSTLHYDGVGLVGCDWLILNNSNATPTSTWYAGANSTNLGNNTGWTFTAVPERYWIGDAGNWNDTTHWSTTSGGVSGATVPTSSDDVYFDANSFTGTTIVTVNVTSVCRNLNTSGLDQNITIYAYGVRLSAYGNVVLSSRATFDFQNYEAFHLASNNTVSLRFNGASFGVSPLYKSGNGTLNLLDKLDLSPTNGFESTFNVQAGTLNTNNQEITCQHFNILYSSIVNLGTSIIRVSESMYAPSTGCTINAGTSHFILDGVGQDFDSGGKTFYDVTIKGASWGAGGANFEGNGTFHNLTFDIKNSYTTTYILFQADSTQTVTNQFTAIGTSARPTQLYGAGFNNWYINFTGSGVATANCDWLVLRDPNATPANAWYAGSNSYAAANSTGWIYGDIGNEQVSNGGFDSSSNWNMSSDWSIASGVTIYAATEFSQIYQSSANMLIPISGSTNYRLSFYLNGGGGSLINISNTSYTVDYVGYNSYPTGRNTVLFTTPADIGVGGVMIAGFVNGGTFTIDDFSIREVL